MLNSTPRILFVGSGRPWAGGAGYLVRQNLFLRALADVGDVHAALFESSDEAMPAFVKSLTPLPPPVKRPVGRIARLREDYTSPLPRMIRTVDPTAARKVVAGLNPDSFDAVFAYRIDFAHFAGVLGRPGLWLDVDDPEFKRQRRRIEATADNVIDPRTARDLAKLESFEKSAVGSAAVSFVCQENDQPGWPRRPEVVPNCVDLVPDPVRRADRPVVLFVGNCGGAAISPNVDAVLYFLADVWPAIRAAVPAAEFRIVGATNEAVRRSAATVTGVTLAGFVDDLSAEYAAASVAVAPIRFGTGTRVKILEAFAHACPVVSTLAGAEGFPAVPGREIELAAGAADFAARVVTLLNDHGTAEKIGRGGRDLAARSYDRRVEQQRLAVRFRHLLATGT